MANPTVQPLAKVEAKTAAELCESLELSDVAQQLLNAGISPSEYLAKLSEHGLNDDGVRFLARALPKREAVFWACLCVREAGLDTSEAAKGALDAAARWVADPSDENRRGAQKAAEQAEGTPESFIAMGAFFSGGSMAPPEAPEVKPAEDFTARSTAGAILLAAVSKEPENAPQKFQRFVEMGIHTANNPLPGGKA